MSTTNLSLTSINLIARDMTASLAFYRLLGLNVPEDRVWWTASGAHHATAEMPGGMLLEIDSHAMATQYNAGWQARQGNGTTSVIGFSVPTRSAVDACHAQMTAAGYACLQPPYDAFWGARYTIIEDPDGNHVGIMSPMDDAHRSAPPAL